MRISKQVFSVLLAALMSVSFAVCCSSSAMAAGGTLDDVKASIRARYGENKRITDGNGNYDESLAVKCVNRTFVGRKTWNVIEFKGIPFVGEQPVGKNRFKKPVPFVKDDGIYEAYHFGKASLQPEASDDEGTFAVSREDCL